MNKRLMALALASGIGLVSCSDGRTGKNDGRIWRSQAALPSEARPDSGAGKSICPCDQGELPQSGPNPNGSKSLGKKDLNRIKAAVFDGVFQYKDVLGGKSVKVELIFCSGKARTVSVKGANEFDGAIRNTLDKILEGVSVATHDEGLEEHAHVKHAVVVRL